MAGVEVVQLRPCLALGVASALSLAKAPEQEVLLLCLAPLEQLGVLLEQPGDAAQLGTLAGWLAGEWSCGAGGDLPPTA